MEDAVAYADNWSDRALWSRSDAPSSSTHAAGCSAWRIPKVGISSAPNGQGEPSRLVAYFQGESVMVMPDAFGRVGISLNNSNDR